MGDSNHEVIDNHLHKISEKKKNNKHVIIGDFNLRDTAWPDAQSSNSVEKLFLDTFSDLGLEQIVETPTHQEGRTLDLILTNKPDHIINLVVLDQHTVCHSDHYGVKFSLKLKVKRIIKKRKVLNYKKADWENINRELNSIKWNDVLDCFEPDLAWLRFKNIIRQITNKYIPTITIKDNNYPPWYDKETFDMAKKKSRLRKKYKNDKTAANYKNYADFRAKLRVLIKSKMRANFEDDEDPALISKKFFRHLKATTGSSRIPETVNYKNRFRSNLQDKANLFNSFFSDQFSEKSKYDIDIDFSDDLKNNINFDF